MSMILYLSTKQIIVFIEVCFVFIPPEYQSLFLLKQTKLFLRIRCNHHKCSCAVQLLNSSSIGTVFIIVIIIIFIHFFQLAHSEKKNSWMVRLTLSVSHSFQFTNQIFLAMSTLHPQTNWHADFLLSWWTILSFWLRRYHNELWLRNPCAA